MVGAMRQEQVADTLNYWSESLERIYQRGITAGSHIQLAWSDMLEHYAVPQYWFMQQIEMRARG